MASGHVNRIQRPNTWLHRPQACDVTILLANSEPSTHGPSRHFAARQRLVVFRDKADSPKPLGRAHLTRAAWFLATAPARSLAGTSVRTGGALFKRSRLRRQMQMPTATGTATTSEDKGSPFRTALAEWKRANADIAA
jgi:hypothetical protein